MTRDEWPLDARQRFQREFHARTLAYIPGFRDVGGAVMVTMGSDADCPAGHALVVALFNMLARAHEHLVLVGDPDAVLACPTAFGHQTVGEATIGMAQAINPFVRVDVVSRPPRSEAGIVLGVGRSVGADIALGADGFIAIVGEGAQIVDRDASVWGSLLSATIGAGAAFQRAAGRAGSEATGRFSLWELGAPDGADGPRVPGPIEVGRVLQAGAGAAGCGLDFALSCVGLCGSWVIADGDGVDVTNLNRQALFVADDAGWPYGPAAGKAPTCAARLRRATGADVASVARWYDEESAVVNAKYDVVLALANERGVRSALQARQPTVLLHATTSERWSAQAHRHIAGLDDCIDCRIPVVAGPMKCSSAELQTTVKPVDAALPFLSMAAGVLLAGQLSRLQHGAISLGQANQVIFDMAEPLPLHESVQRSCRSGCAVRLPREQRLRIDDASRWTALDSAVTARRG